MAVDAVRRPLSIAAIAAIASSRLPLFLPLSLLLPAVAARPHHLFVGNQRPPAVIHALVFDDAMDGFWEEQVLPANTTHTSLAFSFDMSHLYGGSADATHLTTYAVANSSFLAQSSTVGLGGRCANKTAGFVTTSRHFPNFAFSASGASSSLTSWSSSSSLSRSSSASSHVGRTLPVDPQGLPPFPWPGGASCGQTSFADPEGNLRGVAATWAYANASDVQGLVAGRGLAPVLYSADRGGDAVWTHAVGVYGQAFLVGRFATPRGSGPRRLAAHSFGQYVYAVLETSNRLVALRVDPYSGIVRYNESTYSLLPGGEGEGGQGGQGEGVRAADYRATDVVLARSETYLWAVTQARRPDAARPSGFLSAFLLDNDGRIVDKMFTVPTTAVGERQTQTRHDKDHDDHDDHDDDGDARTLAAAPWGSAWVALTDAHTGYVEMWQMTQGRDSAAGTRYRSAQVVARIDSADGGCCGAAVWYN